MIVAQHYKCAKMRAADTMSLQTPRFHRLMSLLCICCSSFVEGTTAPFFSFFFKGQISMRHERLCQGFATMLLFLMRRESVAGGGDRCRGGGPGGDPLFFALSSLVFGHHLEYVICHCVRLLCSPYHHTARRFFRRERCMCLNHQCHCQWFAFRSLSSHRRLNEIETEE